MKKCVKCGQSRSPESFNSNRKAKDGLSSYCKECMLASVAVWRAENPDKVAVNRKKYYDRHRDKVEARRKERNLLNPEKTRALRAKHARTCRLLKRGLCDVALVEKLEAQGFVCTLCEKAITVKTAVIDHCHDTGKTRDLLCSQCNMSLGHIEKDAFYIRAAAYIARHRSIG